MNKFLTFVFLCMNGIIFAAEKPHAKVKNEVVPQRVLAAKAFLALKKDTNGKRKKVDSDDDFSVEEVSSSGKESDEFEADSDDESPKAKVKPKARVRKSGEQQYRDSSSLFKCGIEGCETTCGHQRNVWEHWRKVHKLTKYYECPLECENGKTTHFGTFRKHINDHTAAEKAQIPDRYKIERFPGHPLLSDANMKKAQAYNKKASHAYKKTKIKKEEVESGGSAAGVDSAPANAASTEANAAAFLKVKEEFDSNPEEFVRLTPALASEPLDAVKIAFAAALAAQNTHAQQSAAAVNGSAAALAAESALQASACGAFGRVSPVLRPRVKKVGAVASASVSNDPLTLLARKILKGYAHFRQSDAWKEMQNEGLGAGKRPQAQKEADEQHSQPEPEKWWKPMPHRAMPAGAQPSNVLMATAFGVADVPLDFDAYCAAQKRALAQATHLTPQQLQQQKDFAEMALIEAQLALLTKKSTTDALQPSNFS